MKVTIQHRTIYTYSADGRRCTITHALRALDASRYPTHHHQISDAAIAHHQEIVERAAPKRAGQWRMIESGSTGGGCDAKSWEHTFYSTWQRAD